MQESEEGGPDVELTGAQQNDSEIQAAEPEGPEAQPRDEEELDAETAIAIIESAGSPADFTPRYARSFLLVQEANLNQVFAAFREYRPDIAIERIDEANLLSARHVELLKSASEDPEHPLRSKLDGQRETAEALDAMLLWFGSLAHALQLFRSGDWDDALEALGSNETPTVVLGDVTLSSVMSGMAAGMGEMVAGEIREAAEDHAGARAAFDRATALFRETLAALEEEQPDLPRPDFQVDFCKASSLRVQLAQLLQVNDYRRAAEVAQRAAECLGEGAERLVAFDPESGSLAVPIIRSSAESLMAQMEEAQAEIALERAAWESAAEHARRASEHYEAGGKAALMSALPTARIAQEQMLNTGFNWGVQFHRRLEREQAAQERYEKLNDELQQLTRSVRGALTPAGVTINNQAELVNSVHQQVEIVTRIESRAREMLREVPKALEDAGLPQGEREKLATEALEIASSTESGNGFLVKVKDFAGKLRQVATEAGETAAPLLTLLNALSILP